MSTIYISNSIEINLDVISYFMVWIELFEYIVEPL